MNNPEKNIIIEKILNYTRADWFGLFCEVFSNLKNNRELEKYHDNVYNALYDAKYVIESKNRYEKEDYSVE